VGKYGVILSQNNYEYIKIEVNEKDEVMNQDQAQDSQ
jgi:hypothetical protein